MDETDDDRHGLRILNQSASRPENAIRQPFRTFSEIPRQYHHIHPHGRFYPPQDPYQDYTMPYSHRHYAPSIPRSFPREYQHHQDHPSFPVNLDPRQYPTYRYSHYRHYSRPEPPRRYIPYPLQHRPPPIRTVVPDNGNNYSPFPPINPTSAHYYSFYHHHDYDRPLPSYFSTEIRQEHRACEPYPSYVVPDRQSQEPSHYVKYFSTQIGFRDLAKGTGDVSFVAPELDSPSEESEEKVGAVNLDRPELTPTRLETPLEQPQMKTAVVSKNPYLTLSREEWQEKLQRPSSPMSQEQRDIWHQNVFYAVDAYVFPFPGPPFKCPICDKEERRRSELINHIRSHMPGPNRKPFVCRLCGKGFRRPCLIEDHMDRHAKFPFVCHVCGRGYHRENLLQDHQKSSHTKHQVALQVKQEQAESRPAKRKFSSTEVLFPDDESPGHKIATSETD